MRVLYSLTTCRDNVVVISTIYGVHTIDEFELLRVELRKYKLIDIVLLINFEL